MAWLNVAEKAETAGVDVLAYWEEVDGVDVITKISVTPAKIGYVEGMELAAARKVFCAYGGEEWVINHEHCEAGELKGETVFFISGN